jgi:hypothetical protein
MLLGPPRTSSSGRLFPGHTHTHTHYLFQGSEMCGAEREGTIAHGAVCGVCHIPSSLIGTYFSKRAELKSRPLEEQQIAAECTKAYQATYREKCVRTNLSTHLVESTLMFHQIRHRNDLRLGEERRRIAYVHPVSLSIARMTLTPL